MSNPKWSRDEIILTLNFYHQKYPVIPEKSSTEIEDLSDTLRKLQIKLGDNINEKYRNPNAVYMKLMNFHHFNPNHPGEGLSRGSKLDEEIFLEFKDDLKNLFKISNSIIKTLESDESLEVPDLDDEGYESQEGRLLTRIHRSRERDRKIIKKKKEKVFKETGRLQCEGCGFDFSETYGEHGHGFIECHHLKPVSEIVGGEKTTLNDLSLVCSNCHRMIHHQRPWLSLEKLKRILT